MNVIELIRKGLGFFLMSIGVSSPAKKPQSATKPGAKQTP
jgi:hypothetical protein